MKNTALSVSAALLCSVSALVAQSSDAFSTWWDGTYASGDWAGYRTKMADEGITFFGYYNAILSTNAVGGRSKANAYAQDAYFGFTLDFEKLLGWDGLTFTASGINRDGQSIQQEVGSQYDPMQLVGGQTTFLYGLFLEQKLFEDRLSVKFGRLSASDDFAASPLYGYYLNNGIDGNIRAVLFDTRFSAYPFAVWGGRIRFDPSPEWNAMIGVYQVSDRMFDPNRHGLDFSIQSDDGVLVLMQAGWTPELFKRSVGGGGKQAPEMKGLPGHYFVGAWWSGWDYPQFGKANTAPNSYGFYLHADQMVYQEEPGSDQGLTIFSTLTFAPQENIAIMPFQYNGGAIYKGLLPSRDDDRLIVGAILGQFSQDYADTVAGDPDSELVLELGYRAQLNDWAYIQPDMQWIVNPGGTEDTPNALVVGAQFGVKF